MTPLLFALLSSPVAPADDAPFTEYPEPVRGASVVIELRARDDLGDLEGVCAALEAVDARATLIVDPALATREADRVRAAAKSGHEVAAWITPPSNAPKGIDGMNAWQRAARPQLKAVRKAAGQRPRPALVPTLPRTGEAALDALGVRTILVDRSGRPRRVVSATGVPGGIVIPQSGAGPLTDVDGAELDTAARQIAASAVGGPPAIQIALVLSEIDGDEIALLTRWLTEVAQPAGARPLAAKSIPLRSTASTAGPSEAAPLARPVDRADVLAAAAALGTSARIPRSREGNLNPTEAFLAMALTRADDEPPERVLLGSLRPPTEDARSTLRGGETLPRAAIVDGAARLAPYLTHGIPNFVDVEGGTLTAGEFLLAMARALSSGDDPIALGPAWSPDPHAEGLGWGESTGR